MSISGLLLSALFAATAYAECNSTNKQKSLYANYEFEPSLEEWPGKGQQAIRPSLAAQS